MDERSGVDRAQVSLSVVEGVVGLLVVVAASTTFLVGIPAAGTDEAELTNLATDGLTVLDATPPTGDGASRLTALVRERASFVRERDETDAQLRAVYPPGVRYRLETPYGAVGDPLPPERVVGRAQRHTAGGSVTLRVWFR
jgi:hypothetical protein